MGRPAWFSKLLFAYLSLWLHKQPPLGGVNQPFNKALMDAAACLFVHVNYWYRLQQRRGSMWKREAGEGKQERKSSQHTDKENIL